jgi:diadenosine tetraphosphate (Ap4A) HIT family hydrolase
MSTASTAGLIFETKHWRVTLSEKQTYLGRCVVDLIGSAGSLSELSEVEWQDFAAVVKKLESAIIKAFGPRLFNWSCLLNNAFKSAHPQPHVHWHCRPRYNLPVEVLETVFLDPDFGHHYNRVREAGHPSVKPPLAKEIIHLVQQQLT